MKHSRIFIVCLIVLTASLSTTALAGEKGKMGFLKSLIIPGWGQYDAGRPKHAIAFFSADLLFIGSALSLNHHGKQLRNDYQAFAATHAGVAGSHSKVFYIDVANWLSVFDYNEQRMADRSFGAIYDTESDYWQWDSEGNRAQMDEMRLTSDRSLNRVIYAVALIGVNHVVSAFHAARLHSQSKSETENRMGWQITPERLTDGGGVHFALWW